MAIKDHQEFITALQMVLQLRVAVEQRKTTEGAYGSQVQSEGLMTAINWLWREITDYLMKIENPQERAIRRAFEEAEAKEWLGDVDSRLGQRVIVPIKDKGLKEPGRLQAIIRACVLVSNTAGGDVRFQVDEAAIKECLKGIPSIELFGSRLIIKKRWRQKGWKVVIRGTVHTVFSENLFDALVGAGILTFSRVPLSTALIAMTPRLGVEYHKTLTEDYKWVLSTIGGIWAAALAALATGRQQVVSDFAWPLLLSGAAGICALLLRIWHTFMKGFFSQSNMEDYRFALKGDEEETGRVRRARGFLACGPTIQRTLWSFMVGLLLASVIYGFILLVLRW
jgi:hypothetical protein